MLRATAITVAALWMTMLVAPASSGPASAAADDRLAACAAEAGGDPCIEARCLYAGFAARGDVERAMGVDRLEDLYRSAPGPCIGLYLARALWRIEPERVTTLLEAASAGDALSDSPEAIEARILLGRRARERRDFVRAEALLAASTRRAEDLGDDRLRLKAGLERSSLAIARGDRLGEAYRELARLHDDLCAPRLGQAVDDPSSPWGPELQNCFSSFGRAAYELGSYAESKAAYGRLAELSAALGDRGRQANALYMQAANDSELLYPSDETRATLLAYYRTALELAEEAAHPVRSMLLLQLGALAPEPADARRSFERCLEVARGTDLESCRTAYAAHLATDDPERAAQLVSGVLAVTDDTLAAEDAWFLIYAWRDLARYFWATRPPAAAAESSLELLAAIETLLDRQALGLDRAVLGAVWADAYYWLAGRLLELADTDEAAGIDFDPVERAFEVIERLRARVLLETLAAGDGSVASPSASPDPPDPLIAELVAELDGVLALKVGFHRRLLDPALGETDRRAPLAELERVRRVEADLRGALARARDPRAAPAPARATLDELAASLERDEALLIYQLFHDRDHDDRFAGGAWLVTITWQGTRHYRLPRDLGYFDAADNRIGAVAALRRELADPAAGVGGPVAAGLVAVSQTLLEPALAELPRGIERLVIVPDGVLFQVPFGALRLAPGDEPLLERYQLTLTPSATLWLRWREAGAPPPGRSSLVLADPTLAPPSAGGGDEYAARRSSFVDRLTRQPPLSGAREEAAAIACRLGPSTEVHLDGDASEERLKGSDLGRYGILHFGTHAFADERRERSAVLLAPGDAGEDGVLELAEIAALDLADSLVVLAACDSARGRVLRGEGVIGLARAFFLAGARAVVATLERIDDREAAWLFARFYRYLGAGQPVRVALAEAQRDGRRQGLSETTLASVVLLGDGDLVPVPGGSDARCPRDRLRPAGVGVFALGLLLFAGWWLSGRRSPSA